MTAHLTATTFTPIQSRRECATNESPRSNNTSSSGASHRQYLTGSKRVHSEIEDEVQEEAQIVRRRISRACDQCNQLRRKCTGQHPCVYCSKFRLPCSYTRQHKKRGRISKKANDQQSENNQAAHTLSSPSNDEIAQPRHSVSFPTPDNFNQAEASRFVIPLTNQTSTGQYARSDEISTNIFATNSGISTDMTRSAADVMTQHQQFPAHDSTNFSAQSITYDFASPLGDMYSVAFMGKAPTVESPDWMSIAPQMFTSEMPLLNYSIQSHPTIRYPVLQPLAQQLEPIMPIEVACDLLEQYFTTSTSAYLRPSNPYVLAHIFRKSSILHSHHPRRCSPALLASMIWIVAQISDAPFLTSHLDTRSKICQKLLRLVITLLGPLLHTFAQSDSSLDLYGDAGLADLGGSINTNGGGDQLKADIDNLVTYIHLATVVSASERKASSLRWWNAAWLLARDLKLGKEIPHTETYSNEAGQRGSIDGRVTIASHPGNDNSDLQAQNPEPVTGTTQITEEDREERRRVWWLLYMMDRHLALCYNRPMFFLNRECEKLLQPLDDNAWQEGCFEHFSQRKPGLDIQCISYSVFGYFLPLMVILGEILDLNHTRNRPRFGPRARQSRNFDSTVEEITEQLESYEQSIHEFEIRNSVDTRVIHQNQVNDPTARRLSSDPSSERLLQIQTVAAYARHIMHVLHILVAGKWDPIALLDDDDLWISSHSFVTATGHAVAAAGAVSTIIDLDPDLSFMPFFFGVYLLQGSFLLLLFADKLQEDINFKVVDACETLVRAHEACVATLDTQYQRNFRKVMRSALRQVNGRTRENPTEQRKSRREVLKLYRWTSDGTGLAL